MNRCSPTLLLCVARVTGCAGTTTTTPTGVPIDPRHASVDQDSRVLFVVIHCTVADLAQSLKILTEAGAEVSAHYLISDDAKPVIYRLVPEARRAWHAGPSRWRGHQMLNASSIGIEIVHPGFRLRPDGTREYLPFPSAQIDMLVALLKDIVARHGIRPERVVGHGDVLPQYKEHPGPTFPWQRLADVGLIAWPDAQRVAVQRAVYEQGLPDIAWFQQVLARHGFSPLAGDVLDEATRRTLAAFQMRFRPRRVRRHARCRNRHPPERAGDAMSAARPLRRRTLPLGGTTRSVLGVQ
jgi:N-acetylmuramoyl-L-alanine amidase